MTEQGVDIRTLPGLIATVCTTGMVLPEYAAALMELRSWNDRNDYHKVEYLTFNATLVEAGRDAAVQHMLDNDYAWLLQIDADAAPFPPNSLAQMIEVGFIHLPEVDAIGAYCQLKGDPPVCTIDTGTGTWEEHYPGEGILPVIRTGGHFLFTKRSTFEKIGPKPWFRTRKPLRPIDALAEIDNFSRCELDGHNPFSSSPDWVGLVASARNRDPGPPDLGVGEDSGFCDRLLNAGGAIVVDTGIVAGHVDRRYIVPQDLADAVRERERIMTLRYGVME